MAIETIAGMVADVLDYHYDVPGDVLYLRLAERVGAEVYGEEDDHGLHWMRSIDSDELIGLTVVGFWRIYGTGGEPFVQPRLDEVLERLVGEVAQPLLAA